MPTLGAHFADDEATAVESAAKIAPERKIGPYIAEAVRQRMAREGMMPGNPAAELIAAGEEVGMENALTAVIELKRKKKRVT